MSIEYSNNSNKILVGNLIILGAVAVLVIGVPVVPAPPK